jgi:hypothetical protein
VQVVEVVVLPVGVERDLPVGRHRVGVLLAVRRPVGEVEQLQLGRQVRPQVLVDVDRLARPQPADHQAVALGHRQLDQALVVAAHVRERVRRRHPDEPSPEVVGPVVERAGEPAGGAAAVDHPHAAVAAGVEEGLGPALAVAGDEHRRAAHVERDVGARRGQRARQAQDERLAAEQRVHLAPEAVGRRVDLDRDLHHAVREVGRAGLDVVDQPAGQAAVQRIPVHG